jgi:predicted nuclease with TOPRIM domain
LVKKNAILDQLHEITLLQEKYIAMTSPDMEQFEQTIPEKDVLIDRLNQIDAGFERIYDHVRDELNTNRAFHKDEILGLQDLIRQVTEKSTALQAVELRNKNRIEVLFANRKKEIKNLKLSSKTVSNYYKNMSGQNRGESYFLDKKK